MKIILIALVLMIHPLAKAIPGACYIEIKQNGNTLNYEIERLKTSDFNELTKSLKTLAKHGQATIDDSNMPTGELSFIISTEGVVNLDIILQIKEVLTPFGFDHYTIQSSPGRNYFIVATMGPPIEDQLFTKMKNRKVVSDKDISVDGRNDKVILRNGDTLSGQITDPVIQLKTSYGTRGLKIRTVAYILCKGSDSKADVVELKNGDKLSGTLTHDSFTMVLGDGETMLIKKKDISDISLGDRK